MSSENEKRQKMTTVNSQNETTPEILMKSLEVAWVNFDRRRTYEWKMSPAIWAA
jgi:hypothetical protein